MPLNKWIGMGRLTADPETRQTQTGMQVVKFTVAIDRIPDKNGEKKADFVSYLASCLDYLLVFCFAFLITHLCDHLNVAFLMNQ